MCSNFIMTVSLTNIRDRYETKNQKWSHFRSGAMSCSCRLFGLTLCLSGLALSLYAYYVEEMMEASAGKYTMNDLMKWFRFEYRREM